MTARTRKIIAAMFLLGFAATAPLVVLTTKGYRYNWRRSRLEKTGILVLDSRPAAASIYINGKLQRRPTPTSLFRLLPERYVVRLEKTGYLPWQKVLEVRSGETTFTRDVVLFRDAVPRLLEPGDAASAAFDAAGRRVAMLRRGQEGLELVVYDRQTAATSLLARFSPDKYADAEIVWSPAGAHIMLQATLADGGRELSVYPTASAAAAAPPFNLPRDSWQRAAWSSDGSVLVITTARGLFSADPATGTLSSVILSPRIQDAVAVGREAYLLESEADKVVLEKITLNGRGGAETLADLPDGRYSFTDANARYLALAEDGGSGLLIDRQSGRLAAKTGAARAAWELGPGEGRVLLWNDFEIYVLDPAVGTPQLVTRLGAPLTGAAWHPDGRDLVYSTAGSISAIEIDDRGERNNFELTKLTGIKAFRLDPGGDLLLLVGAAGNSKGVFERDL